MATPRAQLSIFAAVAGLALASLPAYADSDSLPQFNTTLFAEQLFWLAVTFTFLYVLMAYVALPAVRRTQEGRAGTIASELAAAQAANEFAKNMMMQYEKAVADARAEAQATVNSIAAEAARESAAGQASQHQRLAKHLNETEARIAAARDTAVRQVKDTAFDLGSAIVEKMIKAKLNSKPAER